MRELLLLEFEELFELELLELLSLEFEDELELELSELFDDEFELELSELFELELLELLPLELDEELELLLLELFDWKAIVAPAAFMTGASADPRFAGMAACAPPVASAPAATMILSLCFILLSFLKATVSPPRGCAAITVPCSGMLQSDDWFWGDFRRFETPGNLPLTSPDQFSPGD